MRITTDFSDAYAMMNEVQKKQFPFAASVAMNTTMHQIAKKKTGYLAKIMDRYIDKGANPYTKGGFYIYRTNKRRLSGFIGIKDANHYLDTIIYGGQVKPLKNNKKLIQPVNQKLNKYGNIPRNTIKRLTSNKEKYFTTKKPTPGKYGMRPPGVYKRHANNNRLPTLLIRYDRSRRFQRGFFPAPREAARYYKKHFPTNFNIAISNAVQTSKYKAPTGF